MAPPAQEAPWDTVTGRTGQEEPASAPGRPSRVGCPHVHCFGSPVWDLSGHYCSWQGLVGTRHRPALGLGGQLKAAGPEEPGHPSPTSALGLRGKPGYPPISPTAEPTVSPEIPFFWELQGGPCSSPMLAFRKNKCFMLYLTFSYYLCVFNSSLCPAELLRKQFRVSILMKVKS